jgi:hypothetical protein
MHHRKPHRTETLIERIYREENWPQNAAIHQAHPATQTNGQTYWQYLVQQASNEMDPDKLRRSRARQYHSVTVEGNPS